MSLARSPLGARVELRDGEDALAPAAREESARRSAVLLFANLAIFAFLIPSLVTALGWREFPAYLAALYVLGCGLTLGAAGLAWRERPKAAAALTALLSFGILAVLMWIEGPSGARVSGVVLAVTTLGCVLRERLALLLALLLGTPLAVLGSLEALGLATWPAQTNEAPWLPFVRQVCALGLLVLILRRSYEALSQRVLAQAHQSEAALAEEQRILGALESEVRARTADLTTVRDASGRMAGALATDLQEQLGALGAQLERARADAGPVHEHAYLDRACRASARLGDMVQSLLEYAQLGRAGLRCQVLDMTTLVRDVVDPYRATSEGQRVEWQLEPLPEAWGDRVLIRTVLENLISNAAKFSRGRETPRVCVRFAASEGGYCVEDNGVGFEPLASERLFTPFQRLHSSEGFEGHGVGLANVRNIVQRHGGEVHALGRPGAGARISFSLGAERPP